MISTSRRGRLLFVTLSQEIMNGYADEPDDWQSDAQWSREVPLRRRLAIQSLVATVTENCEVDSVQILVEQESGSASGSLRLRQSYFMETTDQSLLTEPQQRDESLLLSPKTTMERVLTCWQMEDWDALYLYIADWDPFAAESKRTQADCVSALSSIPVPAGFSVEGGSVSRAGERATFTVDLSLLSQDGVVEEKNGIVFHLLLEDGIWKIGLSSLTGPFSE